MVFYGWFVWCVLNLIELFSVVMMNMLLGWVLIVYYFLIGRLSIFVSLVHLYFVLPCLSVVI